MAHSRTEQRLEDDPHWYQDAIIYELHVRAFFDGNEDGLGDFKGLSEKLDYLQDLGVTALWLLPFCPSPLKDDGYDIADYMGIHPAYGDMHAFQTFLREAHRRGLRVITELVLNHSSDQHPWFQRARRADRGTPWRDYYVWSDDPERYKEARIIFKDFETSNWTWDPVAKQYFWHRFYSHQPDLNYDHPPVRRAIFRVVDFWLKLGVDGLRLDAVPYLYEREGTNCENLPETHAFLKELRAHMDAKFRNRIILAEANQWPEDAAAYFGQGDECHMAFHFPIMPRMFIAIRTEDRFPILDILEQTPPIQETTQWAIFLRNHDELTLEMVTDEERDYMYRVYASDPQARINLGIRHRLAPLLQNNRRRFELMKALLFSLPGTPVIYYGDEIGMGDNIYLGDRNGVRTPMQWSADRNAGFSRANPQRLYLPVIIDPEYHYESTNVEAQEKNPQSFIWWMKHLIALRKAYKAFGRGRIEFLYPENRKILAFLREYGDERLLLIFNLSRFAQCAELDLSRFRGVDAVEMFGHNDFCPIGDHPFTISLGPHSFYWLLLQPRPAALPIRGVEGPPLVSLPAGERRWDRVFRGRTKALLEKVLPEYLKGRRWFAGKARTVKSALITEVLPLSASASLALVQVDYTEGDSEMYQLTLTSAAGERARQVLQDFPEGVLARLEFKDKESREGVIWEAAMEKDFCAALLSAIGRRRRIKGGAGGAVAWPEKGFRQLRGPGDLSLEPVLLKGEQSNTSIVYGNRLILKLFRRLDLGPNPDLEIGRFLTRKGFPHVPPVAGALEYLPEKGESITLGVLHGFVPNQGDAWAYTLDILKNSFEQALAQREKLEQMELPDDSHLPLAHPELPPLAQEWIGPYLESARLLGQRTAELQLALSGPTEDPSFIPEPFSQLYQRSYYQSLRNLNAQVLRHLRRRIADLPEAVRPEAQRVLELEGAILNRFRWIREVKLPGLRIRCHGDYHLGQVLYTGKEFIIMDFEGEPDRPLGERRIKRSPLRDVAGMLRSFHYAAYAALFAQMESGLIRPELFPLLEKLPPFWSFWVGVVFLREYLERMGPSPLLPRSREEIQSFLHVLLLEKAVYELGYELNHRPGWVQIPLAGIRRLLPDERREGG